MTITTGAASEAEPIAIIVVTIPGGNHLLESWRDQILLSPHGLVGSVDALVEELL